MSLDEGEKRLRRLSRRSFGAAGAAGVAGLAGWAWVLTRSSADGIPWPLRKVLEANEALSKAAFRPAHRAAEFPTSRARMPRVNGMIGMASPNGRPGPADLAAWRLSVETDRGAARTLSLDDIKALPRVEQTTELKCIEGWSTIVTWAGARLADLAASTGLAARSGLGFDRDHPPADLFEYVGLATPDERYFVGLDMPSALHAQTLLCYEMNGKPLTFNHGAPLRLVIPVKYGIKHIKTVATLNFSDERPRDYWAERGYDWYSGH
jgi:DMSO/TMAO reductase YedYZ molybdopterin-dependent catalytic subunit